MKNISVNLVGINNRSSNPDYNFFTVSSHVLKSYLLKYNPETEVNALDFYNDENVTEITKKILFNKPEIVGFSSYVWNIDYISKISKSIKESSKNILIIVGGPQISYDPIKFASDNPNIGIIIYHEPEKTFSHIIGAFTNNKVEEIDKIKGIVFRKGGKIIQTLRREEIRLDEIPSYILNKSYLKTALPKKPFSIIFETSRGCPFSCNYCVWGKTSVRFYSIDRIKKELNVLLKIKRIRRIYISDANFFHNKKRAIEIITFLNKKNKFKIPVQFQQLFSFVLLKMNQCN